MMSFISLTFIAVACIGCLGTLGMTCVFPLLGGMLHFLSLRLSGGSTKDTTRTPVKRIAILIPAHNEAHTLALTLTSVQKSISHLQAKHPKIQVVVRIGADGCTDTSEKIAHSFGVEVLQFPGQGKWKTVHALVKASQDSDWVVMADSGILWPDNFLLECLPLCEQSDVMGVAPTYQNPSPGIVERMIWNLERVLKTLENISGGPVSVHGPTVLYRQAILQTALDQLTRKSEAQQAGWINDDVVISLFLRLTQPQQRIVYLSSVAAFDSVESQIDVKTQKPLRELNRRKRIVLGNLQWMRIILRPYARQNLSASLIACRRIFRMLWAYWMLALAVGGISLMFLLQGLNLSLALSLFIILLAFAIVVSPTLRPLQMLLDAGWVSLMAPYYWMSKQSLSRWK